MSLFVELLVLLRSLVDLFRSIVEACRAARGRDEYVPRHLAARRSGTARKN